VTAGVYRLRMRVGLMIGVLMLGACARIQRNTSEMTPEQMIERSTHVFIGVIEKQELPSRLLIRVTGDDASQWMVVKMKVRVETVLRGTESRPVVDIYEAFPTGGVTGDWNVTHDNERYLFPVRVENGRYRLTRDFWRSVFPVYSGRHDRLPLNDSRPFWERFALLQWWGEPTRSPSFGRSTYIDPGLAFSIWRRVKVLRGLLRHPDSDVRIAACEDLMELGRAQDECWDDLPAEDRQQQDTWKQNRKFETMTDMYWDWALQPLDMDQLRLFTTINNSQLRRKYCGKFRERFPNDIENGCPADQPPPATIVTQDGDVPLLGAWPKQ
jgi:hypothetical protein